MCEISKIYIVLNFVHLKDEVKLSQSYLKLCKVATLSHSRRHYKVKLHSVEFLLCNWHAVGTC